MLTSCLCISNSHPLIAVLVLNFLMEGTNRCSELNVAAGAPVLEIGEEFIGQISQKLFGSNTFFRNPCENGGVVNFIVLKSFGD